MLRIETAKVFEPLPQPARLELPEEDLAAIRMRAALFACLPLQQRSISLSNFGDRAAQPKPTPGTPDPIAS
jgi:hypothetical protein